MATPSADALRRSIAVLLGSRGDIPDPLKKKLKDVTSLRPLVVIYHMLKDGSISTERLQKEYGYDQAPRAAQDVKDHGIKLTSTSGRTSDGHRMVSYALDITGSVGTHKSGRRAFDKREKLAIASDQYDPSCDLCGLSLSIAELQADHRVPYDIAGELSDGDRTRAHVMLLCPSCNRSKSWACEHCPNWEPEARVPATCKSCYWSGNEGHAHAATVKGRWLTLSWRGPDVVDVDDVQEEATRNGVALDVAVRNLVTREAERLRKKRPG